jgi:hypothetical protein
MGAGLGILSSPVTAFDKDKDLDPITLASLISSCMCSMMMLRVATKMPVKGPHIMVAMLACCISSLLSTIMVGTDTTHRFTRA